MAFVTDGLTDRTHKFGNETGRNVWKIIINIELRFFI
jgi:hypothetical protein